MHFDFVSIRWLLMGSALCFGAPGCGSKLKWRVMGPINGQAPSVDPVRIAQHRWIRPSSRKTIRSAGAAVR